MAVKPRDRTIAERSFVVDAPQKRVWDLLANVIFQQLPLEQVDITSFDQFYAVLKWRAGFLSIPLRVEGRVENTSRPTSYGCVMETSKGPIRSKLRVEMTLRAIDDDKTELSCAAMQEDGAGVVGWLAGGLERDFARKSFDSIGARLQWLCSE